MPLSIILSCFFRLCKKSSEIAQELYHFLQKQKKKSLLIFDNVENYETIKKFLPHQSLNNDLHILIISRYQNWNRVVKKLKLKVFNEEETEDFIKKELNVVTAKDVDKLWELVNESEEEWSLILTEKEIQNFIKNIKEHTEDESTKQYIQNIEGLLQKDEDKEAPYVLDNQNNSVNQIKELLKHLKAGPNIADDKVKELHNKFQGLPLALQQAVAYIKRERSKNHRSQVKECRELKVDTLVFLYLSFKENFDQITVSFFRKIGSVK